MIDREIENGKGTTEKSRQSRLEKPEETLGIPGTQQQSAGIVLAAADMLQVL